MFEINVLPFEAEQLAFPQARSQLHVVQLEYPALLGFPQEGRQLLYRKGLHLLVLQLRQGTAFGGIGGNQSLLLCQLHGRGDDLVDVPHGLGT